MEIRVYFEEKVIKNNMLHVYVFILHAKKPRLFDPLNYICIVRNLIKVFKSILVIINKN